MDYYILVYLFYFYVIYGTWLHNRICKSQSRVKNISEGGFLDLFIGTLKDNIQHEVRLFETASLEKDFTMERTVESKNMSITTRKSFSNTYRENNVPSSKTPPRLTPQQLYERR